MVLGPSSVSVKTFAVCTSVLFVKFLVTARLQAVNTFVAGGRPPEDVTLAKMANKHGPPQSFTGTSSDKDDKMARAIERSERWKRIVANDAEWIPTGLLVFAAGLLMENREDVQVGAIVTFSAARLVHTIAYAKGMQPHRSLVWLVSIAAIAVGAGNTLVSVFTS